MDTTTPQVATILVAMVPEILICKQVSLNQKNWSPNGDQANPLTWRVALRRPVEFRENVIMRCL